MRHGQDPHCEMNVHNPYTYVYIIHIYNYIYIIVGYIYIYYIILYYIILHYITLYYIILYIISTCPYFFVPRPIPATSTAVPAATAAQPPSPAT